MCLGIFRQEKTTLAPVKGTKAVEGSRFRKSIKLMLVIHFRQFCQGKIVGKNSSIRQMRIRRLSQMTKTI
jgi:F420-0:gamma-glutamyl ligase-like protein